MAKQTDAVTPLQASALDWLAQSDDMLSRDHQTIWRMAETAWREYRSAPWYVDRLRREGFEVEVGSGGMPTAFCATWGKQGPVIAGYAEYDAVPGQSQEPVPYKTPRAGTTKHTAGRTNPHSALGIGAFAGFLAAKQAMEKHGIKRRLRFFGEPAEKMCGSKPVHAAHGYHDGIDVATKQTFNIYIALWLCARTIRRNSYLTDGFLRVRQIIIRQVPVGDVWPSRRISGVRCVTCRSIADPIAGIESF